MSNVKSAIDPALLAKIKTILIAEEERLTNELSHFTKPDTTSGAADFDTVMPDYGEKDDENALEVAEYTANKPLEIALEKTLRDVQKSLERIEKGIYGVCKYCDTVIDEKRLLARPTSSACVMCKKTLTDEA